MDTVTQTKSFGDEFGYNMQLKFLKALIVDPKWATSVGLEIVNAEAFNNRMLQKICSWVENSYRSFGKPPSETQLTELAREFINESNLESKIFYQYHDLITNLCEADANESLEPYENKLLDFVRQAKWQKTLVEFGTKAMSEQSYLDAINSFKEVLLIGGDREIGLTYENTTDEEFREQLQEDFDPENMLNTGIPDWDEGLGGGFMRKNLHIIGACPGGGKSRTMAFLAKHALSTHKRVLFFTLELSEVETLANINSAATGLTSREMLTNEGRQEFLDKMGRFRKDYNPQLVVKFYKPGQVTTNTIENYITRLIASKEKQGFDGWTPDVIFIDYLDKLLPTQKIKGNQYEDVGGVANDLKNLAITFECPVISGSQLGRYTWSVRGNTVITMDSIAESAQKVHLAHTMTTINMNPGERKEQKARFYLAKARNGNAMGGSTVYVNYNLGRCNISPSESWDADELDKESGEATFANGQSK